MDASLTLLSALVLFAPLVIFGAILSVDLYREAASLVRDTVGPCARAASRALVPRVRALVPRVRALVPRVPRVPRVHKRPAEWYLSRCGEKGLAIRQAASDAILYRGTLRGTVGSRASQHLRRGEPRVTDTFPCPFPPGVRAMLAIRDTRRAIAARASPYAHAAAIVAALVAWECVGVYPATPLGCSAAILCGYAAGALYWVVSVTLNRAARAARAARHSPLASERA